MDALNTGLLFLIIGALGTGVWFLMRKLWDIDRGVTQDMGEIKGDLGVVKTDLGHVKAEQMKMGNRHTEMITRLGVVEKGLADHVAEPHCEEEEDDP